MTPAQITEWRQFIGVKRRQAADLLGIGYTTYCRHESGAKGDEIPRTIELACIAIAAACANGWHEGRSAWVGGIRMEKPLLLFPPP